MNGDCICNPTFFVCVIQNKGGHICLKHHEWSKQWPNFQVGVNFSFKSSCKIVESVKECPLAVKKRCDLEDLVISIQYKRLWLDLWYMSNALSLWCFWGHKETVFFYKIWKTVINDVVYLYIFKESSFRLLPIGYLRV